MHPLLGHLRRLPCRSMARKHAFIQLSQSVKLSVLALAALKLAFDPLARCRSFIDSGSIDQGSAHALQHLRMLMPGVGYGLCFITSVVTSYIPVNMSKHSCTRQARHWYDATIAQGAAHHNFAIATHAENQPWPTTINNN